MKLFKKGKSNKTFIKEVDCHRAAAELGVAPRIIDFYVGGTVKGLGPLSYIVMEKCDQSIIGLLKSQKGILTQLQQNEIENLYKKLDTILILHNDSNLNNLMIKFCPNFKFYLIDYGMSKKTKGNMTTSYPLMMQRITRESNAIIKNSDQKK